jgi:S-methylmethionine-dependent homocysteine/selenocysteine methylase
LCETFADEVEAVVAAEEGLRTALPVWVSLSAGPFGELLEPEELGRIARRVAAMGVERVLVNCVAASRMQAYVDAIVGVGCPTGVYANAGAKDEGLGWGAVKEGAVERYAELAQGWVDAGVTLVGGCCGTGPSHIAALTKRFG